MRDVVYPVGEVRPGNCKWCGCPTGENRSTREKKWCSSKCAQAAAYFRKKTGQRSPVKRNCDYCDRELDYSHGATVKRFCDANCQRNYRWENVPGARQKHMDNSKKLKREKACLNYSQGPRGICANCGDVLISIFGRFCGKSECRAASRRFSYPWSKLCSVPGCDRPSESRGRCPSHYASLWAKENREAKYAATSKRYALTRGADDAERFTRNEIMERDGWVCHLCGGNIDRSLRALCGEYGTVDHIIPVSLGGSHTMDNVAAAHLSCNSRKGARIELDVLDTIPR